MKLRTLAFLTLLFALILLVLLPIVFGELMVASLAKLHLTPSAALFVMVAIVVGGLINIPVKRITRDENFVIHPLAAFGGQWAWVEWKAPSETIIAINVGGCLVPVALAIYELVYLIPLGPSAVLTILAASAVSVVVCYRLARPISGIGIALPGFLPPFIAVAFALVLAPEQPAPFAFVVGITGPLIGADLLHLKDVEKVGGVASIGGAGTFDGIVLSGIIAAYLT